ncbi:hypothetical protein HanRHA438_Chr10g0443181 [Helianthus annuus]|nr:hypothetical protein HanRHA438_Chr10g0443181 [Helianthus annuus]
MASTAGCDSCNSSCKSLAAWMKIGVTLVTIVAFTTIPTTIYICHLNA